MATGYEDLIPAQKAAPTGYEDLVPSSGVPGPRKAAPKTLAQKQAEYQSDVRQTFANLLGGAVAGLGDIGITLRTPFAAAERKIAGLMGREDLYPEVDARAKLRRDLQTAIRAQPESVPFKTSTFLTQAAVIPPVGKLTAQAVSKIPGTQAILPAIESGGLTAGKLTGSKALGARVLGGATVGGLSAGLINPEEAPTGAAAGVGVALGLPVVTQTLGKAAGFIVDAFSGNLPKIQAGKIAANVAGDNIAALRAALAAAPDDINAAQAAYGIYNQGWQALGNLASKTDSASMLLKKQADDRLLELQRLAQAANPTEARALQEESVRVLNALAREMQRIELGAANTAAQTMNRLVPQAQQRQASMVNALQQAGKLETEAAQRAESAARQLQRVQEGQIPAVSATQAARTQAAASRQFGEAADIFQNIAVQRRAERNFIESQIGSLESHGLRPLDTNSIIAAIESKINAPGTRASPTQVKVLQALRDDFLELTRRGGGVMDAHDLYTLRKEGLNERIAQLLGPTDPKVSSKVTAKILGDIKPMIDDAIEKAGGTGWRNYLTTYERGMHAVEQKIMAAQAMKMFEDSPAAYVDLVRGKNPDAVEAIFGPGKFDIFKEMAQKMPTLEKVAAEVERDAALKQLSSGGVEALNEAIEKASLSARLPNLMSRKATLTNLSLDVVEDKINKKTRAILKEGMQSGKSMLEILDTIPAKDRIALLRVMSNPSSWKMRPTETAGIMAAQPENNLAPQVKNQNALAR